MENYILRDYRLYYLILKHCSVKVQTLKDDLCSDAFVLKDPSIAELLPLLSSFLDRTSMKDQYPPIHPLVHIIYLKEIYI